MAKTEKTAAQEETVLSYKGFDANLQCRGYQYAVGGSYENESGAEACRHGFHACEHPLNVFDYYAPAGSRFTLVEQSGTLSRHDSDTKVASSKITIKAEIGIPGLVKAAIEYVTSRCEPVDNDSPASSTGDRGAASSTGDRGAASSTGDQGAASSTGDRGAASSTGYQGAASSTGYQGAASSTGYRGAASSTGYRGAAMACGHQGKAMGAIGNALFLVHRNDEYEITKAGAAIVGQNGIEPDVWYSLNEAGEFVKAED